MEQNTIRIVIIAVVVVLIRIIIKNIKKLRKFSVPKLSQEQLEYNKILDYITDLCINFDDNIYRFLELYVEIINYIQEYNNR